MVDAFQDYVSVAPRHIVHFLSMNCMATRLLSPNFLKQGF